jgi:putative SOS response-associated peptidase YedK
MRWKLSPPMTRDPDMAPWVRWFAWFPVRIEGEIVWLEWVERRCYVLAGGYEEWTTADFRNATPMANGQPMQGPM